MRAKHEERGSGRWNGWSSIDKNLGEASPSVSVIGASEWAVRNPGLGSPRSRSTKTAIAAGELLMQHLKERLKL